MNLNQMKESADFCSLTADLWTSRSNAGFFGVTLAIREIKYPHTGIRIANALNYILLFYKAEINHLS